jgi:hypothetical protein
MSSISVSHPEPKHEPKHGAKTTAVATNSNTMIVIYDSATELWTASIGDAGNLKSITAHGPVDAMSSLLIQLHYDGFVFDQNWAPTS